SEMSAKSIDMDRIEGHGVLPRDRNGIGLGRTEPQPSDPGSIRTVRVGQPGPIRVCFLIDRLGIGGTDTQLLALIRYLDRVRVQPYLVLLDGEDWDIRSETLMHCPLLKLGLHKLVHLNALHSIRRFRSFIHQERIDILQMYFPDSTYFGALAGK